MIEIADLAVDVLQKFDALNDQNIDRPFDNVKFVGVSSARYVRIIEDQRAVVLAYSDNIELDLQFDDQANMELFLTRLRAFT